MASTQTSWPTPMRAIGAQNLLTMPGGVSHSGYLHKKGGSQFSLLKWPLRFIILHKGCVYYFKSSTSPSPQGAFSLNGYNRVMRATEETTSSNVFPFKIVHFSKRHRTWYFSAACEDERKKWMLGLRREINFYHDRKDTHAPSDSDGDGFYGSIEKPLEINYSPDTEDDYVVEDEEDEEEEDEDYLKPDGAQTPPGHSIRPPPAYPPPPIPFPHGISPPPPAPTKNLPTPGLRKPPPPFPPPKMMMKPDHSVEMGIVNKGPPPPLPQKPGLECHPRVPKSPTPPAGPSTLVKKNKSATLGVWTENKPSMPIHGPNTLPICSELEKKLFLGVGPKPPLPLMTHLNSEKRQQEEASKPAMYRPSLAPKPPLNDIKPKPKSSLQRSSPDGQSFRSSLDEVPAHLRKEVQKQGDDSDDDYENVQLPDSVFINTTETSSVEKLFKDTARSPQDGLYGIRNSGTKTSQVLVVWDVGLNKARNYRLFEEDSRVFLEAEITFPTLAALVEYYYLHPLPNHQSLCLQKPYGYTPPR